MNKVRYALFASALLTTFNVSAQARIGDEPQDGRPVLKAQENPPAERAMALEHQYRHHLARLKRLRTMAVEQDRKKRVAQIDELFDQLIDRHERKVEKLHERMSDAQRKDMRRTLGEGRDDESWRKARLARREQRRDKAEKRHEIRLERRDQLTDARKDHREQLRDTRQEHREQRSDARKDNRVQRSDARNNLRVQRNDARMDHREQRIDIRVHNSDRGDLTLRSQRDHDEEARSAIRRDNADAEFEKLRKSLQEKRD